MDKENYNKLGLISDNGSFNLCPFFLENFWHRAGREQCSDKIVFGNKVYYCFNFNAAVLEELEVIYRDHPLVNSLPHYKPTVGLVLEQDVDNEWFDSEADQLTAEQYSWKHGRIVKESYRRFYFFVDIEEFERFKQNPSD